LTNQKQGGTHYPSKKQVISFPPEHSSKREGLTWTHTRREKISTQLDEYSSVPDSARRIEGPAGRTKKKGGIKELQFRCHHHCKDFRKKEDGNGKKTKKKTQKNGRSIENLRGLLPLDQRGHKREKGKAKEGLSLDGKKKGKKTGKDGGKSDSHTKRQIGGKDRSG